jgi:hypothetical protein
LSSAGNPGLEDEMRKIPKRVLSTIPTIPVKIGMDNRGPDLTWEREPSGRYVLVSAVPSHRTLEFLEKEAWKFGKRLS